MFYVLNCFLLQALDIRINIWVFFVLQELVLWHYSNQTRPQDNKMGGRGNKI